jgi:hypothetical protein
MGGLTEVREYWKLEEEALDHSAWRPIAFQKAMGLSEDRLRSECSNAVLLEVSASSDLILKLEDPKDFSLSPNYDRRPNILRCCKHASD